LTVIWKNGYLFNSKQFEVKWLSSKNILTENDSMPRNKYLLIADGDHTSFCFKEDTELRALGYRKT